MNRFWHYLSRSITSEKIALFRIFFAVVLFLQAGNFYRIDFIQKDVIDPVLHFQYPYLNFIKVLDPSIMYGLLILMFISSLMMLIGFRSRIFSALYFLAFTYLFLIDKGYYNNHYYLISLLLLLMCFINSDTSLSILKTKKVNYAWEEYILIFQFSLVLIFAGFNKINAWWLVHHEPVHHILLAKAELSQSSFWNFKGIEYLMVWGGLFFDLLIVPMLLWSKTRTIAIVLFLFFNGMNTVIFYNIGEIGIFPLLMLSSLILFIPSTSIREKLTKWFGYYPKSNKDLKKSGGLSYFSKAVLLVYVSIQLLMPFRHHFYQGNVDYTGEGQRFSWRMKSVYKNFEIAFRLEDEKRGISARLDPRTILTVKQYTNLGYYPELIIPVSENLRKAAKAKGVSNPKIYAEYKVGFMGLPLQYIIDPTIELKTIKYEPFRHSSWILPLTAD